MREFLFNVMIVWLAGYSLLLVCFLMEWLIGLFASDKD